MYLKMLLIGEFFLNTAQQCHTYDAKACLSVALLVPLGSSSSSQVKIRNIKTVHSLLPPSSSMWKSVSYFRDKIAGDFLAKQLNYTQDIHTKVPIFNSRFANRQSQLSQVRKLQIES